MKLMLASGVYREGFVIYIEHEDLTWAHVWYDPEKEKFTVNLGLVGGRESEVILPLDEMLEAMEQAKERLISAGMGPSAR